MLFKTDKKDFRVAPGNRYRKSDDTELVWIIKNVYTPNGFETHARAYPTNDPSDVRLYAASVFGDVRFFDPIHVQVEVGKTSGSKAPAFAEPATLKPAE